MPGGIALIEVRGPLEAWPNSIMALPPPGQLCVRHVPDLDDILVARPALDRLQLMPHGGMHIVKRIQALLKSHGIEWATPANDLWQETSDPVEVAAMNLMPQASSLEAIKLLLAQPSRWRHHTDQWTDHDRDRSHRLNRLLHPPRVMLIGAPNIGKSTLLNTLIGRHAATVDSTPGTTRDWVGAQVQLGPLVVDWMDAPGIRHDADALEQQAIEAALSELPSVDCLIAAADPDTAWPSLPREPDLRIGLRSDRGTIEGADVTCAAALNHGIEEVVQAARATLISDDDMACERPWHFCPSIAPPGIDHRPTEA